MRQNMYVTHNSIRQRGSITVYVCLSILLILSLIFSLLETVRIRGLKARTGAYTNLALESAFAGYQQEIWEDFGLLLLPMTAGGESFSPRGVESYMEKIANANACSAEGGTSFFTTENQQMHITGYELITDQRGKVFLDYISKFMKYEISMAAAKKLKEQFAPEEAQNGTMTPNELRDQAKNALVQTQQNPYVVQGRSTNQSEQTPFEIANPIYTVDESLSLGILNLVAPGKTISNETVCLSQPLMKRELNQGTISNKVQTGWYERILLQQYIRMHFSSYVSKEKGTTSYQQEYIIGGKKKERENLEQVAWKIVGIREAANFMYLMTDEGKKGEALIVAAAISLLAGNPEITEIVQKGILASWALAESISDVRELLNGNKIPAIKTGSDWKTSLLGTGNSLYIPDGSQSMDQKERGLSYEDYLQILFAALSEKEIAYRTLDLMERSMMTEDQSRSLHMDQMAISMKIEGEYQYKILFLNMVPKEFYSEFSKYNTHNSISNSAEFSYYK